MKLKILFNDIQFSFKFAQTHLNVGMPSLMRTHSTRHRTDIDRIRQTDDDASLLANFRNNINTKNTGENATGAEDYAQMVDIVIRNGGMLDHYAGPRDLAHWAEAKNLKSQIQAVLESQSLGELKTAGSAVLNNRSVTGALSLGRTALHSAISEIQATLGQELTPAAIDALATSIVSELDAASVEVNGDKITVDDFKNYLAEVGDGIMAPPEFKI